MKTEQDEIMEGNSPLESVSKEENFLAHSLLLKDALNYRDNVANYMIKDGWQTQGIELMEETRSFSKSISVD